MTYVLLIVSDSYFCDTLMSYLEMRGLVGFQTETTDKIRKCIEQHGKPALTLYDFQMGHIEDPSLMKLLQSDTLVIMTAVNQPEKLQEKLKAKYLLIKPFTIQDLDEILCNTKLLTLK